MLTLDWMGKVNAKLPFADVVTVTVFTYTVKRDTESSSHRHGNVLDARDALGVAAAWATTRAMARE